MNRSLFWISLALLLLCAPARADEPAPACPLGGEYEFAPEMSDEFNGDALDLDKWWNFNPAWRGRKPALFSRENVKVSDGALQLTASLMKPEEVDVEMKARGYDKFWKAIVKSRQKMAYGYYEARCKSMKACVCNAFWLYDPFSDRPDIKYVEGEFSEEIDILEYCGKPHAESQNRVYWATIHRRRQRGFRARERFLPSPAPYHARLRDYGRLVRGTGPGRFARDLLDRLRPRLEAQERAGAGAAPARSEKELSVPAQTCAACKKVL